MASATSALHCKESVRLHGCIDTICPPIACTASTVSAPVATLMSQPTIFAPSRANASAAARPMLPPVPVMMQTLSVKRPAIFITLYVWMPIDEKCFRFSSRHRRLPHDGVVHKDLVNRNMKVADSYQIAGRKRKPAAISILVMRLGLDRPHIFTLESADDFVPHALNRIIKLIEHDL